VARHGLFFIFWETEVTKVPTPSQCASRPTGSPRVERLRNSGSADPAATQGGQNSRWRHITSVLQACCGANPRGALPASAPAGTARCVATNGTKSGTKSGTSNATIRLLERPSPTSAVISWRDPTGSSYGYQVWRKRLAARGGQCALSGALIRRGDAIFRPADRGSRPGNAWAMILAACIEQPNRMTQSGSWPAGASPCEQ
jgi:hypothetical protein